MKIMDDALPYSKREVDSHFQFLGEKMDSGFKGMTDRLDTLNGKTAATEKWKERVSGGGLVVVALLLPTLGWLLLSVITLQKNQVSQTQMKAIITDAIKNNIIIPVSTPTK